MQQQPEGSGVIRIEDAQWRRETPGNSSKLASHYASEVIGQPQATEAAARIVTRVKSGIRSNPKLPYGAYLMFGPTGVGKSELARLMADALGWDFLKFNGANFQGQDGLHRLFGAAPGYIGYGHEPPLHPNLLRRKNVFLFDEVDQAHDSVLNWLQQAIGDGISNPVPVPTGKYDQLGQPVVKYQPMNFRQSLFIFTTNETANELAEFKTQQEQWRRRRMTPEEEQRKMSELLAEGRFKNKRALLGRIREFIPFNTLQPQDLRQILDLQVRRFNKTRAHGGVKILLDDFVAQRVISSSDVERFGARNLHSALDRVVIDPIGERKLNWRFFRGDTVQASIPEDDPDGPIHFDSKYHGVKRAMSIAVYNAPRPPEIADAAKRFIIFLTEDVTAEKRARKKR